MSQATTAYAGVIDFHGHDCPGAALGLRVAQVAVSRLGRNSPDNELIAVSETDMCALDAIQVVTGCTVGKRNLVPVDNGKNVFTFWRVSDGASVRIQAKPDSVAFRSAELWALNNKITNGTATEEERKQFSVKQQERIQALLDLPEEEILIVGETAQDMPAKKSGYPYSPCGRCSEPTSVDKLHNHRGTMMCPACHLDAHGGQLPADHGSHGHGHGHGH